MANCCYAQTDTFARKSLDTLTKKVDKLSIAVSKISQATDTLANEKQEAKCTPFCGSRDGKFTRVEVILCFLPSVLFLIVLWFLSRRLVGFELKDALKENNPILKTQLNPLFTQENFNALAANPSLAANPNMAMALKPTIDVSDNTVNSSSRFLALLTTVVALLLAVCFVTYYIYSYFRSGVALDFTKLTDIVLSLGIGVVPYAFNKISSALK